MMKKYDIIVIGAGHAGVEASLAAARMQKKTLLITLHKDKIALMPCNPSIGGPAKGIVVREIDAIGGEMAKAADATALQMKLLNSSRGPAVWALRAQSDKIKYAKYMQTVIEKQDNLDLYEGAVQELLVDNNNCYGVILKDQTQFLAKKVILTTGTYMQSLVLQGMTKKVEGPDGDVTTDGLSTQLKHLGFELFRLKTGTPARVLNTSIDYTKAQEEPGSDLPLAFSYSTKTFTSLQEQELCWLIHSTPQTHSIVQENLTSSAMYSGNVQGTGPRYCPSFEDKIVRFADKPRHQIFLEPESKSLNTIYVQGFSTSMSIDVQEKMLRSLPGFENVEVLKWAYAIEYDAIVPTQLKHTLETKNINNLYTAGQINGTSGYEEAACQGLMAGINAVLSIDHKEPFILRRDQAYIGVLIDDLITKGTQEPYRLLTSRAEYRLLLRNDNAEERLKKYANQFGLIDQESWEEYQVNVQNYNVVIQLLKETFFMAKSPLIQKLNELSVANITERISAYNLLKRPNIELKYLEKELSPLNNLKSFLKQNLLINIRFKGYIKKEQEIALKTIKLEKKLIPFNLNYDLVDNLSLEAREKFKQIRPISIGQANRISGINPADIQMLLFHLKKMEFDANR
ncbi:tRNA uridine-5-carboxymethylaminomethyl(34) synthesis enzyme MnmG [Spiroplasma endosymbiont of Polydrusus pterygomalis]|uniref:tRNA uridine-5-carboxymethylaminomethyl(34) synthesis enzyme MnmG n=1 Tax=Spiroplasma endosymbiont of Polydrusus pterygomalis TaxID=3139327 RepID=UPI003CCAF9FD